MLKKLSALLFPLFIFALCAPQALAQSDDGIALAPARFELEMAPGSETTVVVNLDYHTSRADAQTYRKTAGASPSSRPANYFILNHSPQPTSQVRKGGLPPLVVSVLVPR